jgi:hypothetical protein
MALEGIINSVKNFGKAALLTGAMLVSGCIGFHYEHPHSAVNARSRFTLDGYFMCNTDVGDKLQTIPAHPDDGGPAAGSVTLNPNEGVAASLTYGIEAATDKKHYNLKVGADLRLNIFGANVQELQDLPAGYESYGYLDLKQGILTPTPFIGAEYRFNRSSSLGLEIGFPYTKWEAEAGHYRHDNYDAICGGEWMGFGQRYALELKFDEIAVRLMYEQYKPKFGDERGKIGTLSMSVLMSEF